MNKKVLFILHLPPPTHGASVVGKYIHDSEYINSGIDAKYVNLATARDLNDIGKLGLKKIAQIFIILFRVIKAAISFRPDLVYITPNAGGSAFIKDFLVVEILKMMGMKIIAHYHNKGVHFRENRKIDNVLYRIFFRKLKVILLSECLYVDVKKYVKREDVFICANGIPDIGNVQNFEKDFVNKLPGLDEPFRILFLSNMMAEKGVWSLIDACHLLKEEGYNIHCDFIGKWSDVDRETIEKCIEEYNLKDNVHAYGAMYGSDRDKFFNNADLFVFPTFYFKECFPLVLLEAMQHGLPCVSTNEGAIPEIVDNGKTGYLVNSQSEWGVIRRLWKVHSGLVVEKRIDRKIRRVDGKIRYIDSVDEPLYVSKFTTELSNKIRKLIDDPELASQMGREARRKYEEKYSLDVFEHNFRNVIDVMLQDK